MSESKTPFNRELIELLLLFSFIVLWLRVHSQPLNNERAHFQENIQLISDGHQITLQDGSSKMLVAE
jgi:hypothetical protein